MKEKLTLLIILSISLIIIILYTCIPVMAISSFTEQKLNDSSVEITEIETITSETQDTLQKEVEKIEVETEENLLQSTPEEIITEVIIIEFPIAQFIWDSLIDLGYSEYVAAGIIGNLVAEVGDPSTKDSNFDLDWESNTGIEIGLCQWTQGRRKAIIDRYGSSPHYIQQFEFMIDELLGTNGVTRQVTEEQYQLMINASSPKEAAYYFARYFERCAKGSYQARQNKAQQAYEYFKSTN